MENKQKGSVFTRTGMKNNTNNFRAIIATASMDWENPEEINMRWFGQDRDTLENILKHLYPECDTGRLAFLYKCYDFLENQIHQFLEADGMAYEKSNWILKQYFEHLVGGIPDGLEGDFYDPECAGRKCDQPEFGSTYDWIEFIDAMYDMYRNGMTKNVVKCLKYMHSKHEEYLNR